MGESRRRSRRAGRIAGLRHIEGQRPETKLRRTWRCDRWPRLLVREGSSFDPPCASSRPISELATRLYKGMSQHTGAEVRNGPDTGQRFCYKRALLAAGRRFIAPLIGCSSTGDIPGARGPVRVASVMIRSAGHAFRAAGAAFRLTGTVFAASASVLRRPETHSERRGPHSG